MVMYRCARAILALALGVIPGGAFAAHNGEQNFLFVGLGAPISFSTVVQNAVGVLVMSIAFLCVVLFLLGAFLMVMSRGKEDQLQKGRELMIHSLIGLAIVLGSYAILRTFFALIYL
jgi:hypothetical protein